jgi:hypothetical protein
VGRTAAWQFWLLVVVLVSAAAGVAATADDDPVFVRFLIPDDPFDETLRDYWERSERDELGAAELVDLGTMLFERGFPTDAIRTYRRAIKLDGSLYEAWFRVGLAYHSQGDLSRAAEAYRRCLKKSPGHGWANFYYGRLEEELGHSRSAMYHLEAAFTHAPELANPKVNPEVLNSELALGAELVAYDQRQAEEDMPMTYLQPKSVAAVRRQFEPEEPEEPTTVAPEPAPSEPPEAGGDTVGGPVTTTRGRAPSELESGPAPTPVPQRPPRTIPVRRAPTPPTAGPDDRMGGDTPYGTPEIGSVSGEGRVVP